MIGFASHRLSRFALIGGAATLIYAVCAALLTTGGTPILPAAAGSFAAYAIAALFSYAGHKYFTFVSRGAHRFEAPRFLALTAAGLCFSWMLPALMVGGLQAPPLAPIVATCVVVPAVNYFVLGRWVFSNA